MAGGLGLQSSKLRLGRSFFLIGVFAGILGTGRSGQKQHNESQCAGRVNEGEWSHDDLLKGMSRDSQCRSFSWTKSNGVSCKGSHVNHLAAGTPGAGFGLDAAGWFLAALPAGAVGGEIPLRHHVPVAADQLLAALVAVSAASLFVVHVAT